MHTLLYNPANKTKKQLIEEFVIRTKVFESIMKDLRSSNTAYPGQHYLLIGQRGSGKTTLMQRIKYAIEDDEELDYLIPLSLGEEQYGIIELANLWERIAEILDDYYGFDGLYEELQNELDKPNYEEKCFNKLIDHLNKKDKQLVLFMDNFGDLLKKIDDIEIKRLREILTTCNALRLIAASPVIIDDVLDYQRPLFEFFKTVPLKGLNSNEIKKLLLKLAEINKTDAVIKEVIANEPERIEVLRNLTGGVTRTIVLLYGIFVDNIEGTAIKDLQLTLDAVTPLYKHRMDDLPKNQQKIVDAVAKSWDATSVKDIVKKTRIESKIISAQLRTLEKNQVIKKITTGKKNHLYQIKERFFNIWYLMRYGRKYNKTRVIWLVRFLESWYSREELENRISSHMQSLGEGKYDKEAAMLLSEAYIASTTIPINLKQELIRKSKEILPKDVTKGMSVSESEYVSELGQPYKNDNYVEALKLHNSGKYEKALEYALKISSKDITVNKFLLYLYNRLNMFEKAVECSDMLIEEYPYDGNIDGSKGYALYNLGRNSEAIETMKTAIAKDDKYSYVTLGFAYLEEKDYKNAEKYLLEGLKFEGSRVDSLYYLGLLHKKINQKKEAITYYKKAIEAGDKGSYLSLARLYYENNDFDNALIYYNKAIEHENKRACLELAALLFDIGEKESQKKALSLIKDAETYIPFNFGEKILYARILLWNNELERSVEVINNALGEFKIYDGEDGHRLGFITSYFSQLMSYGYSDVAYDLLIKNDLTEVLKPLYFTLMYLMKDDYPDEYLKMGDELKEVVEEIVSDINKKKQSRTK